MQGFTVEAAGSMWMNGENRSNKADSTVESIVYRIARSVEGEAMLKWSA